MNHRQEIPGGLLVPGRDAPVLLHLRPEPLHQVPILVTIAVDHPLHLAILLRRDDRRAALRLDRPDQRLAVEALVADDNLEGKALDEPLPLRDVGRLAGRQDQFDGQPQPTDGRVDLGAEAAPAAAQGLFLLPPTAVRFFPRRRRRGGRG